MRILPFPCSGWEAISVLRFGEMKTLVGSNLQHRRLTVVLVMLFLIGFYMFLTSTGSSSFQFYPHYSRALECQEGAQAGSRAPSPTTLANVVFGIAAGSELWEIRKEYVRAWWRPESMRGFVWLDKMVESSNDLPPLRVSEDTSRFNYTYVGGAPVKEQKQQLRICRIAVEMFKLRLPDVRWFVVGDDDTVFVAENMAKLLSKYDHTQYHYIGANSETHRQNTADGCCTGNMAYGGAGYAISYPLAEALEKTLDQCMERYTDLYGASTRIHACLLELGVPLTREPGLHQFDIVGDASGVLGAHPIAPLVSLHHIDRIAPLFPTMTRQESLVHFFSAVNVDATGILQQSLCYSREQNWSIQVSWGYAVQVTPILLPPRVLENPLRTFTGWGVGSLDETFTFKTRPVPEDPCHRPVMFFMQTAVQGTNGSSLSNYTRGPSNGCTKQDALAEIAWITVRKEANDKSWYQAPTRQCCRIRKSKQQNLVLKVRNCHKGEVSAIQ